MCDGQNDCGDQSDETSAACQQVTCDDDDHFHCANGKCIQKWRICDGIDNCGDGFDEANTTCKSFDINTLYVTQQRPLYHMREKKAKICLRIRAIRPGFSLPIYINGSCRI